MVVVLLAAVVCAVDPSLRHAIGREATRLRYDIVPSYLKVPIEAVLATGTR